MIHSCRRVAVLGEEYELLSQRRGRPRYLPGPVPRPPAPDAAGHSDRREDVAEQARELSPARVATLLPKTEHEGLQLCEGLYLRLQLRNRAGRGRSLQQARLGRLGLVLRRVVQPDRRPRPGSARRPTGPPRGRPAHPAVALRAPGAQFSKPLAPRAQRPVDRPGARTAAAAGQSSRQSRQCRYPYFGAGQRARSPARSARPVWTRPPRRSPVPLFHRPCGAALVATRSGAGRLGARSAVHERRCRRTCRQIL